MQLRTVPGLPDPHVQPPVVAAVGDPFADLRVVHLLARVPRGEPVRIRDIVERLDAEHLDWSFSRPVVIAAVVQLQANWRADYRSSDGIVLAGGAGRPGAAHRGQQSCRSLDRAPGRAASRRVPGTAAPLLDRRGNRALSSGRGSLSRAPGRSPRGSRSPAPAGRARCWSGRRRRSLRPDRSRAGPRRCRRA